MQRKVFRIEQMMADAGERRASAAGPKRGLSALRDLVTLQRHNITALIYDGQQRRLTAAAGELGAAIEAMESATQSILKGAEHADGHARRLEALLSDGDDRACVKALQNDLAHIYEACNFQDLAGQRIAKVIEVLDMLDAHLAALLTEGDAPAAATKADSHLINGPKLDGASGHISQHDIDMLFG